MCSNDNAMQACWRSSKRMASSSACTGSPTHPLSPQCTTLTGPPSSNFLAMTVSLGELRCFAAHSSKTGEAQTEWRTSGPSPRISQARYVKSYYSLCQKKRELFRMNLNMHLFKQSKINAILLKYIWMGCDNTSFLLKMQVFDAKLPTNSLRLLLQYTPTPSVQNKNLSGWMICICLDWNRESA